MPASVAFAFIDEPPFCFPASGGRAIGYDVEVALKAFAIMGIDVEMHLVSFAELIPGVAEGRWRINTPLFVTPERQQRVAFSRGVWALADGLLVRGGDVGKITGYEELAADPSLSLIVVAGQIQEQSAEKAGVSPHRILRVASPEQAVQALRLGLGDAYASVALAHRGFLEREPDPTLAIVDCVGAADVGTCRAAAIGAYSFARHDEAFRNAFDKALDSFHGSPDHRLIMERYGFTGTDMVPGTSAVR